MATGHLIRLGAAHCERLAAWAREAYPEEACGLLIGRRLGGVSQVDEVRRARNANTERAGDRFEIDPADYLAAEDAAAERGAEVVGVWHTHPDHPACPSETDRAQAWAGWSYLIASVDADGVQDMRCWRLNDERAFDEEVIHT